MKSIDISKYTGPKANPFEDLDAWDAAPSQPVSYVVAGSVADEADLSASFKVMWTSSNLCIELILLIRSVMNCSLQNGGKPDNIEYHFDMGNQRDGASCESVDPDTYDQDNFQYRAIVGKGELQTGSTPAPNWNGIQQATYDLYDEAGTTVIGYTIEVNFPWATLNTTSGLNFVPANGAHFAIDLKVSDTDPVAGQPWSSVTWSTYEFSGLNRNDSQFGVMTITGATGISENRTLKLDVFPNPAHDFVTVSLEKASSGSISLVDMTGKIISSRTLQNEQLVRFDTRNFSKGIYFVTVTENSQVYRSKLVIQ
ncbi:MAG: T9SS type A sorting domain-containing protein [Bacteroidales bacterium]